MTLEPIAYFVVFFLKAAFDAGVTVLNLDQFLPKTVTCAFSSGSILNRAPCDYNDLHKAVILAVRISLLFPQLFQFRTILDAFGQLPWSNSYNGYRLPGPSGSSPTGHYAVHHWFRTDAGVSNISLPVHPTPISGNFYTGKHQIGSLLKQDRAQRATPNWDNTTPVHNNKHLPNWGTEEPVMFLHTISPRRGTWTSCFAIPMIHRR